MKMTREFYISKGSHKVTDKNSTAVAYLAESERRPGVFFLTAFSGKRQKPDLNFSYKSRADAIKRLTSYFKSIQNAEARKREQQDARRAEAEKGHGLEVGIILTGSWGYDQTNVDFFEVTRVTKKSVWVEQIGSQSATDAGDPDHMTDRVVPNPEHRTGKITRHTPRNGSIKSPVHGWASVWDGAPKYESSYH